MAVLPILKNEYINREVTDSFSGYRHRLRIEEGELYDCRNLTNRHYPLLANREKRGHVHRMKEAGALLAKEKGLTVVALTSVNHSSASPSRHRSGKRLFEIADIVLDNMVSLVMQA